MKGWPLFGGKQNKCELIMIRPREHSWHSSCVLRKPMKLPLPELSIIKRKQWAVLVRGGHETGGDAETVLSKGSSRQLCTRGSADHHFCSPTSLARLGVSWVTLLSPTQAAYRAFLLEDLGGEDFA